METPYRSFVTVGSDGNVLVLHAFGGTAEEKERNEHSVIFRVAVGDYNFLVAVDAVAFTQFFPEEESIVQDIEIVRLTGYGRMDYNVCGITFARIRMPAKVIPAS
jgi:hypothetical protein